MSDYQLYHALGQGGPNNNPANPDLRTQLDPSQFHPQATSAQYHQAGAKYNPAAEHNTPYGNAQRQPPSAPEAGGDPGYFSPQGQPRPDGGLAAQMGGLALGEGVAGRKKKKDRHAYHALEAPSGPSAAFNGTPQGPVAHSAYLNAEPSIQTPAGSQFLNQPSTPQTSQFPAAVNAPYSPSNPASAQEFASRNGSVDPRFSANVQTSAQGRVDPDQIPSVPASRDGVAQYYLNHIYPTFEHHVPPPASVSFVAFDQGNASPKFTRLTMNNIPSTSEALHSTGLPLGLLLQPLASLQPGRSEERRVGKECLE